MFSEVGTQYSILKCTNNIQMEIKLAYSEALNKQTKIED